MAPIPINIADYVGRTPMVQLTRLAPDAPAELFAKLEMLNPGGSVKDRIGVAMIEAAEREGRIEPGRTTIVEATSRQHRHRAGVRLRGARATSSSSRCPQGMSREREGLLRLYGAQVRVTESIGGMNEAVAAAQALARERRVLAPRPVLEPCEPGGAPPHDRAGDLGRAGRQGRLPRGRRRHRRHDHRRRRAT